MRAPPPTCGGAMGEHLGVGRARPGAPTGGAAVERSRRASQAVASVARALRSSGPRDVLAGTTVAVVLIPQALAYAGVAGMPPITGLYAAALPPLAAALFASSPYLQTGPVAQTSLLTFGALAALAPAGTDRYVELGVLLALVVGVVRVALGATRTGFVAYLMSEPMLMGFLPAGAILVICSQVPAAVGASPADDGVVARALTALANPSGWGSSEIAVTLMTLVIVFGGRRIHALFPGVPIALVAGLVGGTAAGLGEPVGPIPSGLPRISLALPWEELPALLLPGAVIALVGFAEPASIARTYATRERQPWNADREFVSQGVANLVSGLSGGYPVGGSLSRTSLNHMAGAVTRASGAVTGLVVLAFLPFASVLSALPKAVLAAIVISAVLGLLRFGRLVDLWRVSRPQFAVAASTFALTLILAPHIERAIVVGVALSMLVHLLRELSVRIDVSLADRTLEIRPRGVLWFGNAQRVQQRLITVLARHDDVPRLRLVLDGLGRIDVTGAIALYEVIEDAARAGRQVDVEGVPPHSRAMLERLGARRASLG
jgi:SulP family sulfate permease